ncbi:TonB family protein [Mucilaginibacter sp. BJC16-A38]|uniref:energy transducer TonB n=1 Tax=Mucilaginibacter phenanthrenivorans TaxID=1234842 RepID=UPI00215787C4|nr:energy transducer TonB [Mucilaginibacter phenanthrenivorans]MCR8557176.1 TonB family protein [Mucilaginibacter phenanthrenivorans]
MLISKFNLYKTEWLDLVFDDRNKAYGAYELRQHNSRTMARAMGAAFLGIGLLCGASVIINSAKPIVHITTVNLQPAVTPPVIPPVKKVDPPKAPEHLKPQPLKTIATTKFVPPVVVIDPKAEKPVENDKITGAIGQQTLKGEAGANVDIPDDKPAGGGGTAAVDNSVHADFGLDVMPEPAGGMAGWAKFLSHNLRFPPDAQQDGISGRVFLSFIIEKDGHLSNITVDRPAGHGFDEEALRVLKLAKAWKPGMQNGQPVRVKYSIPINFQLTNND